MEQHISVVSDFLDHGTSLWLWHSLRRLIQLAKCLQQCLAYRNSHTLLLQLRHNAIPVLQEWHQQFLCLHLSALVSSVSASPSQALRLTQPRVAPGNSSLRYYQFSSPHRKTHLFLSISSKIPAE